MKHVAIIGGGPAGLMAAEIIASQGFSVSIYDQMPSVGRKFLMAGRGGLNLTHSEPLDPFIQRYGAASSWLGPLIKQFPPDALRAWCHGLDQTTFVGTSGRVFPTKLKASPLLRAWLQRLDKLGVRFLLKQKWQGWDDKDELIFIGPDNKQTYVKVDAVLLALGGASWPRLGSDGHWVDLLRPYNIQITQLAPANSGFMVPWSSIFLQKFEGQPLKPITAHLDGRTLQGEALVTAKGIEGSLIYALSHNLREAITNHGTTTLTLDLRPGLSRKDLMARLQAPRGSQSLSNYLRKFAGLSPLIIGLLYETKQNLSSMTADELCTLIKACPLTLTSPTSIERAISTAGGIARDALDKHFMLKNKPGTFAAGEILDWEAPTGGYLLQACFSTAVATANGIVTWLNKDADTHAKV